jgi:hypothetical protein
MNKASNIRRALIASVVAASAAIASSAKPPSAASRAASSPATASVATALLIPAGRPLLGLLLDQSSLILDDFESLVFLIDNFRGSHCGRGFGWSCRLDRHVHERGRYEVADTTHTLTLVVRLIELSIEFLTEKGQT